MAERAGAPFFHDSLAEVRLADHPLTQLHMLDSLPVGDDPAAYRAAMQSFAADPTASDSILVRSYALECARQIDPNTSEDDARSRGTDYRVMNGIVASEGLQGAFSFESSLRYSPRAALRIGERFAWARGANPEATLCEYGPQTARMIISAALAEELGNPEAAQLSAVDREFIKLENVLALGRVSYDGDRIYGLVADNLRALVGEEAALEYARTLNGLHESVGNLRDLFPEAIANSVAEGARKLVAGTLLVLERHARTHHTTVTVDLIKGDTLSMPFSGDEPLRLLQQLDATLRNLHHDVTGEDCYAMLATIGQQNSFKQYRFFDANSDRPPRSALYIRPEASRRLDDEYDFGRPWRGVEATMSYAGQVSAARPIPLTKYRGRASRPNQPPEPVPDIIYIRTDREGHGDPTRHDGHLVFDLGSIKGPRKAFGTKIAFLMAYADQLDRAIELEDSCYDAPNGSLNHVPLYGTQFGQSDYFARLAMELDNTMAQRRPPRPIVRRYFARLAARDATALAVAS